MIPGLYKWILYHAILHQKWDLWGLSYSESPKKIWQLTIFCLEEAFSSDFKLCYPFPSVFLGSVVRLRGEMHGCVIFLYSSSVRRQEKAMAPYSSTVAGKIPRTEEPYRLQSMGSLSRTRLSDFTFIFHFHALEKEMATHSSVLAWRIPGTGEPGGLPSMGSHRVGHDWHDLAGAAAAVLGDIILLLYES